MRASPLPLQVGSVLLARRPAATQRSRQHCQRGPHEHSHAQRRLHAHAFRGPGCPTHACILLHAALGAQWAPTAAARSTCHIGRQLEGLCYKSVFTQAAQNAVRCGRWPLHIPSGRPCSRTRTWSARGRVLLDPTARQARRRQAVLTAASDSMLPRRSGCPAHAALERVGM